MGTGRLAPAHLCVRNMKEEIPPSYIHLRLMAVSRTRTESSRTRSLLHTQGKGRQGGKTRGTNRAMKSCTMSLYP